MIIQYTTLLFTAFLLFSSPAIGVSDTTANDTDYYQKGIELIEAGDITGALDKWILVKADLEQNGEADFRIGIKAIEVITQERLEKFYPLASEFYYWALKTRDIEKYQDEIQQEIDRLKPLVDEKVYKRWDTKLKNRNPEVLNEIRGFFVRQNPIQSSPVNERLIEHWERIAYARENFTINRRSVYGTDDRGIVYVKYGEPTRMEKGYFNLNVGHIQSVVRETINQQDRLRSMDPSNEMMSADAQLLDSPLSALENELFKKNLTNLITDYVLMQQVSRDYEVWVYEMYDYGLRRNATFLFGVNANSRRYGLQKSVEDFIPISAFRERSMRIGSYRYNAGPIFQLAFYNDLKSVDDTYLDIYHDFFDRIMMSDISITSESSFNYLQHRYADELESIRRAAPDNTSVYDRLIPEIEYHFEHFRFLDENLEPYELVYAFTRPHFHVLNDYNTFIDSYDVEPEYHLRHTLTQYDKDWNLINRTNDFPYIMFETYYSAGNFIPSSSAFVVGGDYYDHNLLFSASVYNQSYAENQLISSRNNHLIPAEILAETSVEVTSVSSTNPLDASAVEMSDIVIGFSATDTMDSVDEEILIPFYVPLDKKITNDLDLNVLFELYNIRMISDDEVVNYNVEYQVVSKQRRGFFNRLFGRSAEDTSVILEFETRDNAYRHYVTIDLSDYEPGDFELKVSIHDDNGSRILQKTEPFSIVEAE